MGNQPSNEGGSSRGQDQIHSHGGHHVNHATYNNINHKASSPNSNYPSNYHPNATATTSPTSSSQHAASQHSRDVAQRSSSDASMGASMDQPPSQQPMGNNMHVSISASEDDVVPTVFRWEHGGREVYITGTFNGWTRQIPMHRSGNDFTYIHNLKRGKHAFKFIVDDEWRFAPDQPTVADIEGRINNFIDVTDFKPYMGDKNFEQEKSAAYYAQSTTAHTATSSSSAKGYGHHGDDGSGMDKSSTHGVVTDDPDGEVFSTEIPDLDEYTKDPPPLPPHSRHIILNKPPQLQDTAALPVPQHVALNHLYCTAIRDNMMVLGITQRYKTKFVTTVYYSPELSR